MLPDRVSNPGPLTYESGALPIALRGPAPKDQKIYILQYDDIRGDFLRVGENISKVSRGIGQTQFRC